MKPRILIVDDEQDVAVAIAYELHGRYRTQTANSVADALAKAEVDPPDVIITDVNMPGHGGFDLLAQFRVAHPDVPAIIMTGLCDKGVAVRALREHAFDIFEKPIDLDAMVNAVAKAIEMRQKLVARDKILNRMAIAKKEMESQAQALADLTATAPVPRLEIRDAFRAMITNDPVCLGRLQYASIIATTGLPVLITGETGTGKDVLARALHAASGRSGAFVAANVAGLDDGMLGDALFGHVAGAFTNADRVRPGLVESAAGGTLFLDEIGDLSPSSQIKLLRLMENREYYPLGSDKVRTTDAAIVAATHHGIEALVAKGTFRSDLYFRLKSHHVHLPALRERLDDLPLLVDHFVTEAAHELKRPRPTYSAELIAQLRRHPFYGNLRELRGLIYDAVGTCLSGVITAEFFAGKLAPPPSRALAATLAATSDSTNATLPTLRGASDALLEEALRRANGNQAEAARILGVSRQALNKRLSRRNKRAG